MRGSRWGVASKVAHQFTMVTANWLQPRATAALPTISQPGPAWARPVPASMCTAVARVSKAMLPRYSVSTRAGRLTRPRLLRGPRWRAVSRSNCASPWSIR